MSTSTTKTNDQERVIEVELTEPQMKVHMVQANTTYVLAGRGTGKTVGILAPWMVRVAEAMPGHLSGIFGQTFEHLDKSIMPKIFDGFHKLGYQKNIDYVIGKPPDSWPKCIYEIKKFERTITWRNGTTWQQISLHDKGSASGFDFQSGIFDEAKYMDSVQLDEEVTQTFRGYEDKFGHLPDYLATIYATDKLYDYPKIKWLLDKRNLVDKEKVANVISLQEKVNELEGVLETATTSQAQKLGYAIKRINTRLATLRKTLVYVCEASARSNIKNLGAAWWAHQRKKLTKYSFDVSIENEDPILSKEGFYPNLSDAHLYNELYPGYDCIPTIPMIVTFDYQHSIAPLCVAQIGTLPGSDKATLNFINEFYALYPLGLDQAVDQFCEFYKHHAIRSVYYTYDQTAIGKRPSAVPVYKTVINRFKKHGWTAREVYMGDTPTHYDKFKNINDRLSEEDGKHYGVRFNKDRCIWTLTSMRAAGTVVTSGETKKDKEYENTSRHPDVDQRATTHFSDTFDQLEWSVNEMKLIRKQSSGGGSGAGFR